MHRIAPRRSLTAILVIIGIGVLAIGQLGCRPSQPAISSQQVGGDSPQLDSPTDPPTDSLDSGGRREVFPEVQPVAFLQVAAGDDHPFAKRFPMAEFPKDMAWLNTGGPLRMRDLRGKFVLLDFWTYCCINCMHILPELKKLEQAYPNELVVIGVHSAKFETEKDTQEHHRSRSCATRSSTRSSTMPSTRFGIASACKAGRRSS